MKVHVLKFNKQKFFGGLLLLALGVCMPYFLTIYNFGIPRLAYDAVVDQDKMELWIAAVLLVALNSLRAFPHYIGAFIVAESIEVGRNSKVAEWMKAAIVIVLVPPVYFFISNIHHIRYDFGIPALALVALLLLLGKQDYNYVSLWKKTMLIVVFLSAFQFLDVMPALKGLPIGRGEMSQEIKLVANFLEMEPELNLTVMIFFFLLLFMGVLLFLLIRDENNLKAMNELKEQNERMVMDTKLRVLENRTYIEMRHLVHDLKSPLTSAQGLVGVVRMSCEREKMEKECGYLDRVEGAIERMSGMISEILYETHRSRFTTEEIFNSVLSQISVSEYSRLVHVDNRVPEKYLHVNKVRFTRAIVNLLENSFYALAEEGGRIDLTVDVVKVEERPSIQDAAASTNLFGWSSLPDAKAADKRGVSGTDGVAAADAAAAVRGTTTAARGTTTAARGTATAARGTTTAARGTITAARGTATAGVSAPAPKPAIPVILNQADSEGVPDSFFAVPDEQIRIGIRDNGKGIGADILKLIWESGFSTRASHGLGLSFVKKVVTNSGGTIRIESKLTVGTYVELIMPEECGETGSAGGDSCGL